MAWTNPMTFVATNILTALQLNTYVRDNTNYLKGLLDGTGSDGVVVPAGLYVNNDASWYISKNGSNPLINFDANDALIYDRASDAFQVYIGAQYALTVSSAGRLSGLGFYDSGIFSLAASGTTLVTHGFATRPRYLGGYYSLTNNDANLTTPVDANNGVGADVAIYSADTAQLAVRNGTGSTMYIRVYAKL